MYLRWLKILVIIVFIFGFVSTSAFALDRATERAAFLAALADLQRGNQTQFDTIATRINDYPLYPYLLYADLAIHLPEATQAQIQTFLTVYGDTPLAVHMRSIWLLQLAQQKQWNAYLANYQTTKDIGLQCLEHQALWETGQKQAALNGLVDLLGSATLPRSCLEVFAEAVQTGDVAENLIWQRLQLAIQNNNLSLVEALTNLLPFNQRPVVTVWLDVYKNPDLLTQPQVFKLAQDQAGPILLTGLARLADKNPELAVLIWEQVRRNTVFSWDIEQQAIRTLALALAVSHDPNAEVWLARIPDQYVDDNVRAWRVRSALYAQDWPNVQAAILEMTPEEQALSSWRYWLARAYAAQGQEQMALNIYHDLSLHGDYYGQLASLQLHQQPLMALTTMKVAPQQILALGQLPVMQRAYELYQLQWLPEAEQEWHWAIKHMPEEDYLAAAELAIQWGWYERAIATINLMNDGSDIALRFPLAFRDQILSVSTTDQLNPAWVFALIRQESLFMPNAHSCVGALGLMQLLPATALLLADRLHMQFNSACLFDPSTNLLLGGIYLKKMAALFNNNPVVATAAYNAGPARVQKWLPAKPIPADIWIDTIPFPETRDYVKNIMEGTTFYERELNVPTSLAWRLRPIVNQ